VGPADREVPRDREIGSKDEGCRRCKRRRGLRGYRGHQRVPLVKANLLTYLAHALLDSKVLIVANGGAAWRYAGELRPWRPSRGCGRARVKQGEAIGR